MGNKPKYITSHSKEEDRQLEDENGLVLSYLTMRNLIGFLGIALPFILAIGSCRDLPYLVENSISDYYYTPKGDILVVVLCVLGVFLFTYFGYDWKEWAVTTIAAIGGVGVAFVPTTPGTDTCDSSIHAITNGMTELFGASTHLGCAATFLLALAVISIHYFPMSRSGAFKTPDGKRTQKGKRNLTYKVCGWTMVACVTLLAVYFVIRYFVNKDFMGEFPVIFLFETLAVWAFGFSWLTKGQTFWPDGEHYAITAWRRVKSKETYR